MKINNDDVYELVEGDYCEPEYEESPKVTHRKTPLTPEQKAAAKLQNDAKLYKSHCVESYLFTRDSQNLQLFRELIEVSATAKELQTKIKSIRARILESMNKCKCSRAIDLQHRKQLTISSGKVTSRKVFDEEKFKKEQPELYKKYCFSVPTGGVGGTLVLKDISDKAFKSYSNPDNSQYFMSEVPEIVHDFNGNYTPTCPRGYDDCVCDPAYIKCWHPEWYQKLYGNITPEEAAEGCRQRVIDDPNEEGYCYDDEDK